MLINKLTKIGLGVAIGALILGMLSACSSDSDVSSYTTLDSRGYSSTERLVSTKWVEDNLEYEKVKIMVNGAWIGIADDPYALYKFLQRKTI